MEPDSEVVRIWPSPARDTTKQPVEAKPQQPVKTMDKTVGVAREGVFSGAEEDEKNIAVMNEKRATKPGDPILEKRPLIKRERFSGPHKAERDKRDEASLAKAKMDAEIADAMNQAGMNRANDKDIRGSWQNKKVADASGPTWHRPRGGFWS